MFEVIGKIAVILFIITAGVVLMAFGLGYATVVAWPILIIAIPIAIAIYIVVKVIRA